MQPTPADRPRIRPLPPPGSLPRAILGRDGTLLRALETARRLAARGRPVLLLGETGTGKELVARAIHDASPRGSGPFLAVNCAAIPPGLLGAELFGAVPGAYTGAEGGRPGLLEGAHRGTLFLDEIGDMGPDLQAALLRVLEDGAVRRLGAVEEVRVEFGLVAATHRDLGRLVGEGRFRADLLYRLGRILRIPPLRERPGDVLLLARAFLAEAADGGRPAVLDAGAEAWLLAHPFPGNVRELRCRLLAAAALAEGGVVGRADLEEDGTGPSLEPFPAERGGAGSILEALRHGPPRTVGALVRETNVPRRTVQRLLASLVRDGGILREGRGPATRYAVTPPGADGEATGSPRRTSEGI